MAHPEINNTLPLFPTITGICIHINDSAEATTLKIKNMMEIDGTSCIAHMLLTYQQLI